MELVLDGKTITSEGAFHEAVRRASGADYYGANLDALDEVLGDMPAPVTISWDNAAVSRAKMGKRFDAILEVILDVVVERGADEVRFRLDS